MRVILAKAITIIGVCVIGVLLGKAIAIGLERMVIPPKLTLSCTPTRVVYYTPYQNGDLIQQSGYVCMEYIGDWRWAVRQLAEREKLDAQAE